VLLTARNFEPSMVTQPPASMAWARDHWINVTPA